MWYLVPKFAPTASGPPSVPRGAAGPEPDGDGVVPGRVSPAKNALAVTPVAPGGPVTPVAPIAPIAPVDVAESAELVGADPDGGPLKTVASLSRPARIVAASVVPPPEEEEEVDEASGLPHAAQNVSVARAAVPQRGQFIGTTANYPANGGGAQLNGFAIC